MFQMMTRLPADDAAQSTCDKCAVALLGEVTLQHLDDDRVRSHVTARRTVPRRRCI